MAPALRSKLALVLVFLLSACALCILTLGLPIFTFLVFVAFFVLYASHETLLGQLAGWGIGRIPQAYRWTIERISIRPAWSEKDDWSELVVSNWTWHNPIGFDVPGAVPAQPGDFLLQIDELKFRLKLSSIYAAVKDHKAIKVDLMSVRGLRFNTQRNSRGALNLWQALALPDDDVNVRSISNQAAKHGGIHDAADEPDDDHPRVVPLPPVSTAATRASADYWRPEWGEKPCRGDGASPQSRESAGSPIAIASTSNSPQITTPLVQKEKCYVEEPIGDPRRRPRWGVPIRFDIERVHILDVHLWVLDLMTMDSHKTSQNMDSEKKRIQVHSLNISRKRLEAGDLRRAGSVDDVHGVYLGELIWVIIAEIIPLVLKKSPGAISRTLALATCFAVKDAAKRLGAKTVQAAHSAGHAVKEAAHFRFLQTSQPAGGCRLHVHLIGGRQVTRKGCKVNVHAFFELMNSAGVKISSARSEPQMWTKAPFWDENFEITGVSSLSDILRVTLHHRKSRQVVGLTHSPKEVPERFIGEVTLPIKALLIRDAVISEGGEIVGWFALSDPRGLRQRTLCTGELKMGLRLTEVDGLISQDGDLSTRSSDSHHFLSDWAILK